MFCSIMHHGFVLLSVQTSFVVELEKTKRERSMGLLFSDPLNLPRQIWM